MLRSRTNYEIDVFLVFLTVIELANHFLLLAFIGCSCNSNTQSLQLVSSFIL